MRLLSFILLISIAGCGGGPDAVLTPIPKRAPGLGNEANNGGGLAEKNVVFAYLNLPRYVSLCLASRKCELTAPERALLDRIARQTVDEKRLVFGSERAEPGTFQLDGRAHGLVRSARTGDAPESNIWINSDHISAPEPVDVPGAAALLLDEAAHHADPKFKDAAEHARLDTLCAKFRIFLLQWIQTIDWKPEWNDFGAIAINPAQTGTAELLLFDRLGHYSVSARIVAVARTACPEKKQALTGYSIRNLHWGDADWQNTAPWFTRYAVTIRAWVTLQCALEDTGIVKGYRRELAVSAVLQAHYEKEKVAFWTVLENETTVVIP